MADTKALRQAIERQIAELQRKLRAVEVVEDLDREMLATPLPPRRASVKPSEAEPEAQTQLLPLPGGPPTLDENTVIDVVKRSLGAAWHDVSHYFDIVLREIPDAKKAAVSTALARLVERRIAESKPRGSRREGYLYRKIP
jgi:hypothetical protein